ncbi:MAG TPA: hypothetical protein V6C65_40805, partial [Allocoleopsis sp.]
VQEAIDKAEKARTVYNKLNDLDAIEAWVKSQPDGAIVGYVNHQCKCPLSYYLAANGFQNVQIGNLFDLSTFRVGKDDSSQFLPDIASGIAAYVDDERLPDEAYEKDADPSLRQPPVTKERMLEIIAEARTWDLT